MEPFMSHHITKAALTHGLCDLRYQTWVKQMVRKTPSQLRNTLLLKKV